MNIYDFLQLLGGFILSVGYIPQIIQLHKTKSCADISLKTYLFLTLGMLMMEIYAINLTLSGHGQMFLITNSIALIFTLYISILIIKYKGRNDND